MFVTCLLVSGSRRKGTANCALNLHRAQTATWAASRSTQQLQVQGWRKPVKPGACQVLNAQLTVFRNPKSGGPGAQASREPPSFAQVLREMAPTGKLDDFVVYDSDGKQHQLLDVVGSYGPEDKDMKATLVIWPRHFGCVLCRRLVKELAAREQAFRQERKWRLMVIGCGTPEQAAKFRTDATLGPLPASIPVYTDPLRRSYLALRFRRGILSTFNLPALQNILDSFQKGERQRWDMIPPDAFQQGGIALIERDTGALWMLYRSQYAGDAPTAEDLLNIEL
ncbi:hypothetical protein, conserved [Cyanidioschyzon merolae strain 10D]|jgi:hypothetical protein|uniref:Uncharacterized protein n=1 Tax=Cyanidioschyzon merolae (strain NIES-3377 / 10D) TaxID=280699 RepID=M1VEZ2_CYAM1|nr:hypothetical protein, conserved [Cyanidioschyzon merolae strain 10D]BAM81517.1 hypothetical protein, conserved [Cyanidioschyzon merolae strain 10D]|eukprot:XP_005537553.1 hypothetical protein, conserved [Cyanidioschyzon merolae strain 10D]